MNFEELDAEQIIIKDRQRKEFEDSDIEDLAHSIRNVGLIHAPVVTTQGELVAGERRLRALRISQTFKYGGIEFTYPAVPCHVVPYSDPKLLFEIELEENIRRVNLTPLEKAEAIAKLHNIRKAEEPTRTIKQTAEEVAKFEGKVANENDQQIVADSILVDSFKDDPEVIKAAKSGGLKKAAKVAKKKLELMFNAALVEDEVISDEFQVYNGDCKDVMKLIPDSSVDIILFDPPYGIGANKFGEQAEALGHQYEDDLHTAFRVIDSVLENKSVLKPESHILMFCSIEHFGMWSKFYEQHEFEVWPRPLIWDKGNGHLPVPDRGPRYTYEAILFASRGKRKVVKVINDVLRYSPVGDKLHAAEKPAELIAALIDFIARPGDRILDPCCGSGTIFTAARGKAVSVTGIEINNEYYGLARSRAGRG